MYAIKKSLLLIFLFHHSFQIEILCPCDVTDGNCDLLCCCDPDCTIPDLNAFRCQQAQQELNENWIVKACVPNSLIFTSNTPYVISTISSLFCVEYKEIFLPTENKNYLINQTDLQNIFFDESIVALNTEKNYFDISDYVWTINKQNQISYLTSQKANDVVPFRFLKNRHKEFIIDLNNFNDENIQNETTFFESFKIINSPKFEMNCSNLTNFYDSCSSLIVIDISCSYNNSIQDCSFFNSTPDTLFISSYQFIIEYSNPNGIKSANIIFEFLEKALFNTTQFFTQNFKLEFKNINSASSVKNSLGYNIGSAIQISDINQTDSISIKVVSPSSNCDPSSRISVQFGKNMATECYISVEKLSDLTSTCKKLGDKIKNVQLENGIFLNFVASYRDLIKYNPNEEWIKAENLFTGPSFEAIFESCGQMATGLSIQIAYAKVGNALKPLNKIVKVQYQWLQNDVNLQCFNTMCNDRVKVSTFVTFVDVSLVAKLEEAKIYSQGGIVSNDFFAPLVSISSKLNSSNLKFILLTFYFTNLYKNKFFFTFQ